MARYLPDKKGQHVGYCRNPPFSPPPPPSMTNPSSWSTIPIRLLSSVAVVGRENEPIYLRGDLCYVADRSVDSRDTVDEEAGDTGSQLHNLDDSPSFKQRRGLLGRMKDVVGRKEEGTKNDSIDDDANAEAEDDDPFGFFTEQNHAQSSMSLTQQLVLHASLDRFEEMTIRSGSNAGRWRMPGSSGPNAMWMGLLCEVEERWNVYGYLTNTGIKFMIIVENVQLDEDGIQQHEHASSSFVDPISTSTSSNREADLKQIFTHLHELYVRYTLNPFSKLRSPIQSRIFDQAIMDMARSFNEKAMRSVREEDSYSLEGSLSWM